ncbi:hypothetical protein [Psychroflexus aestuariivivens]|uniref:hypothetical protein n=1 Tax=Psychroflexus aestuariivivens TaxID=1795040 RepID=UPI000FDCA845|nr:hypothetical protein [Psychroflexus aestuariivivens]
MIRLLLIPFFTLFVSCVQSGEKNPIEIENKGNNQNTIQKYKTLKLDFDFTILLGKEEDFGDFKTYSFLHLKRQNESVFIDSSLIEYEFRNELFPLIVKSGENSFELLLEINDRPNKNYLKRIFIQNNKSIKEDKLPIFESKPIDINNDGINEYGGYWEYSQVWGENEELTAYNPILYYKKTNSGFKLDSALTKIRNEKIYGNFYGFSFSEKYEQSAKVIENFNNELNIINATH